MTLDDQITFSIAIKWSNIDPNLQSNQTQIQEYFQCTFSKSTRSHQTKLIQGLNIHKQQPEITILNNAKFSWHIQKRSKTIRYGHLFPLVVESKILPDYKNQTSRKTTTIPVNNSQIHIKLNTNTQHDTQELNMSTLNLQQSSILPKLFKHQPTFITHKL